MQGAIVPPSQGKSSHKLALYEHCEVLPGGYGHLFLFWLREEHWSCGAGGYHCGLGIATAGLTMETMAMAAVMKLYKAMLIMTLLLIEGECWYVMHKESDGSVLESMRGPGAIY